jgi:multidrug resistance efflux pump
MKTMLLLAVLVATRTGGTVEKVYVQPGETVRSGQPLATLETDHLLAALRVAEAKVKRARSIEAAAKAEYEINPNAKERYERAVAAREAAWMEAAGIRRIFFDSIIRAPQAGVIEKLEIEPGDQISEGTVTFVIK